jgi:hypothetical protein
MRRNSSPFKWRHYAHDAGAYVRRFCGWMKNNRLRIDPFLSALREGFTTEPFLNPSRVF